MCKNNIRAWISLDLGPPSTNLNADYIIRIKDCEHIFADRRQNTKLPVKYFQNISSLPVLEVCQGTKMNRMIISITMYSNARLSCVLGTLWQNEYPSIFFQIAFTIVFIFNDKCQIYNTHTRTNKMQITCQNIRNDCHQDKTMDPDTRCLSMELVLI